MQGGRTVQQDRMFLNNLIQYVPNFGTHLFYHTFCTLDVMGHAVFHQTLHDERLEQLQCHLLGKTTLIELQFRTHYNNTSSGVVHSFSQQVLSETTLFSLQHIGQGFQRTGTGARYRATSSPIINQRIHRFLQHTFFISHNNIRSTQLQ